MTPQLAPTPRTTLRRGAARGRNERAEIDAILDEAYIAHVGFVVDGEPRVLPMAYGRDGDSLYLHGAVANAMLRASDRKGGVWGKMGSVRCTLGGRRIIKKQ